MLDPSTDSRLEMLVKHGASRDAVARWKSFLEYATDSDLDPIDPTSLAERWMLGTREVLGELVVGSRAGLFDLHWNVVCSACGGGEEHAELGALCSVGECRACGNTYDVFLDRNVEVVFRVHPGLRSEKSTVSVDHGRSVSRITGLEVAVLPEFREFFAADTLSSEESLKVGDVTIMFTDIKGSTSLYEDLGDARAFSAVRQHFRLMFEAIADHGGSVVKTIGDALMVNYARSDQAVLAALTIQETFREFRPLLPDRADAIVLKIGIHRGPCLAVTLNDRLDYFGTAVNVAARVLSFSKGGDVAITDDVASDSAVKALLDRRAPRRLEFETPLRGLTSTFRVHVLRAQGPDSSDDR